MLFSVKQVVSYKKGNMWYCSEVNFSSRHSRSDTMLSGNRVLTSSINTRATLDAQSHKNSPQHCLTFFLIFSLHHTHTRTEATTTIKWNQFMIRFETGVTNSNFQLIYLLFFLTPEHLHTNLEKLSAFIE